MKRDTLSIGSGKPVEVFYSSKPNPSTVFEYVDSSLPGEVAKKKNNAKPWYNWGSNNLFPVEIFELVYKNDIKPELIKQSVDLIIGKGIFCYVEELDTATGKEKIKIVKDAAIESFFRINKINHFIRERAHNLELFANAFTEMVRDGNNKISYIRNRSAIDVRAESICPEHGRIMNYFICGDWKKPKYNADDLENNTVIKIPSFDIDEPEAYDKFIHHSKYYLPGQDYYSFPSWFFGTKTWAELSNIIPKYQLANLNNGASIRFHVRIPKSYFDNYPTQELKDAKKAEIQDSIDDLLSGAENASKTFFSYIETIGGTNAQGWEIIPINFDSKDQTFLEAFNVSSRANSRGHGIHPILSGLDIQGNLGSGSEILNLYNYHISIKTLGQRDILLDVLYDIAAINGWDPNIKFGIKYVEMTTTDKNPTGKQNVA